VVEVLATYELNELAGLLFSNIMTLSSKNSLLVPRQSYVAQFISMSVFIAGTVSVVGSDDLLAAFAAG
jgi:sodium/hydrogen antiporter